MRNSAPEKFQSILASELTGFLSYREANGHDSSNERRVLKKLDAYLFDIGLSEKRLDAEILDAWINSRSIGRNTKCIYISILRQLSHYLYGTGIPACCPTSMRMKRSYVPYVLSHEEIQRLFDACDNLEADKRLTNAALWFPVMARMLYGCGLRVSEAVSLKNKDIDWEKRILTIRKAKGNKDRLVPMSDSLTEICASYYAVFHPAANPEDYFFHNKKGERFPIVRPYMWLRRAYDQAGIDRKPDPAQTRGICVHTLRHTFAVYTLQNQCSSGVERFYAVPILSTYMGHNDIYGTEIYLRLTQEYHETLIKKTEAYNGSIFPEVTI